MPVTKIHPVNLGLLQQYFNNSLLDINSTSLFTDPLNITLPSFQIFSHNFSSIVAREQNAHLDLKKMVDAAKKDQIIYTALTEPMLNVDATDKEISYSFCFIYSVLIMYFSLYSWHGLSSKEI